jgi:hypothetical protein
MKNGFCAREDAVGHPVADATLCEQAATDLAAMLMLAEEFRILWDRIYAQVSLTWAIQPTFAGRPRCHEV